MKGTRLARPGKWCISVASVAAMLSWPVIGLADDDVTTWRVQTHYPQGSIYFQTDIMELAERIEDRTDGRLQLDVHGAGSLFGSDEIFSAVERGVLPMGQLTPGYITGRSDLAAIAFGMPYTFDNVWEASHYFYHRGFLDALQEDLSSSYGVHYAPTVFFPTEMVSKQRIESLDDFSSMTIRSSGPLQTFLTEVGASGSMIPGEEIYQSLATGVVDAAHWGAATGASSLSLYEVVNYHVKPPISIASNAVIINEEAKAELPEDVRNGLQRALNEHVWHTTVKAEMGETTLLRKAMSDHGIEVIELPEDVTDKMAEIAGEMRQRKAEESELAAQQIENMNEFLEELGRQ